MKGAVSSWLIGAVWVLGRRIGDELHYQYGLGRNLVLLPEAKGSIFWGVSPGKAGTSAFITAFVPTCSLRRSRGRSPRNLAQQPASSSSLDQIQENLPRADTPRRSRKAKTTKTTQDPSNLLDLATSPSPKTKSRTKKSSSSVSDDPLASVVPPKRSRMSKVDLAPQDALPSTDELNPASVSPGNNDDGDDDDIQPRSTSKRKAKSSNSTVAEKPFYWRNESDLFIIRLPPPPSSSSTLPGSDETNAFDWSQVQLRYKVRGNPRPLRRHRNSRGFMYNPSAKAQESFRNVVQEIMTQSGQNRAAGPWFPSSLPLAMTLVFRIKRPKHHLVTGQAAGPGRLRAQAPSALQPTRMDVDNLAKFVLDALNGLAYVDDRQVASLMVTKLLDDDDDCLGSTEVGLRVIHDEESLAQLVNNSFGLFS